MSVTGVGLVDRDENFRQIDRLVSSSVLQGSESLCKLLRFLAEQTLGNTGAAIKEYQIATEVFGRPANFDPRLDSTVRVQTGRLRSKLGEYYAGPGSEDPVIVEIPKGSYALTFQFRSVPPRNPQPTPVAVLPMPERAPLAVGTIPRKTETDWLPITLGAGVLSLTGAVLILSYLLMTKAPATANASAPTVDVLTLKAFWKSFIERSDPPWAIFSNAEFTGRPETGLRYFNPDTDSRTGIMDHYTGVGEVLAIHELDTIFNLMNHGLRVKRGRLLSLDDAKNNDLIFVGSPSENLPLREIPTSREFVFRRADVPTRKGDLAIVNAHPRNGEQRLYFASPGNMLADDYAIIALVPGMNQSHAVLVLAGITTIGTEAAVEYVCRPRTIEDLLLKLTGSKTGNVVPFEAVLKVKVSRGVPVNGEIVAIHAR